jgi:CheY-like chemotaxis protein
MESRTIRLLILDDSAEDCARLVQLLRSGMGDRLELATADAAGTGLELLRSHLPYDCLLLDHALGEASAPAMLQLLREEFGELPCACIVLTEAADERAIVESIKAGAWDHLSKRHLSAEALRIAVERAAQVSRLQRELAQQNAQWEQAEAQLFDAELQRAELAGMRKAVATYMHELNSPLTGVINCVGMLLDEAPTSDQRVWLEQVRDACTKMAEVLKRMETLKEMQLRPGADPSGPLELHLGGRAVSQPLGGAGDGTLQNAVR